MRRASVILYETHGPTLPPHRVIDEAELLRLAATPQFHDVFIFADLIRGEGVLGHRSPTTGKFEMWVTPGLAGTTGARVLSSAAMRMLVVLVRSTQPITPLEAYQQAHPNGPTITANSARLLLNEALATIDFEVKPGVRLSTLRVPSRAGLAPRFLIRFGWAASMQTGKPGRALKVCILITEAVDVDQPYDWAQAPGLIAQPSRANLALTTPKSRKKEKSLVACDMASSRAPRTRRKSRRQREPAEVAAGNADKAIDWLPDDAELAAGLAQGRVLTVAKMTQVSFRKP